LPPLRRGRPPPRRPPPAHPGRLRAPPKKGIANRTGSPILDANSSHLRVDRPVIAALIIVFREIIEAGLVVGIVLAATAGVAGRGRWVAAGILGGATGAGLVAAFAGVLGSAFAGTGQELFNAAILFAAVLMLGWHNVWMARHGRAVAAEMRSVGEQVASGTRTLAALAIVVGVAVLREGSEIVLFLYGVALSGGDSAAQMALGGALGIGLGAAV